MSHAAAWKRLTEECLRSADGSASVMGYLVGINVPLPFDPQTQGQAAHMKAWHCAMADIFATHGLIYGNTDFKTGAIRTKLPAEILALHAGLRPQVER